MDSPGIDAQKSLELASHIADFAPEEKSGGESEAANGLNEAGPDCKKPLAERPRVGSSKTLWLPASAPVGLTAPSRRGESPPYQGDPSQAQS